MQTIGRQWRGQRGDFQSICDYCGVVWLRSQLRRDGSGNLACPDEGRGRDSTTLSRLNAEHAARAQATQVRDGGRADTSGREYFTSPQSALETGSGRTSIGTMDLRGWWNPSQSAHITGPTVRWVQNLQKLRSPVVTGGDVYQPLASSRPAYSAGELTYVNQAMSSNDEELIQAGDLPCLWLVGSFGTAGETELAGFSVASKRGTGAELILFLDGTDLTFSFKFRFHIANDETEYSSTVSAVAQLSDDDKHLFTAWSDIDGIRLAIDGETVGSFIWGPAAINPGASQGLGIVGLGGGHVPGVAYVKFAGTIDEAALSSATPTASEFAEMQAYFKRNYPELNL